MLPKIILASQSPRRKQLLEWAEIDFEIITQPTDESFPASMPVEDVPVFIANNKAIAVKNFIADHNPQLASLPVLAADTIVVLNNTVIGKPMDREDAIAILQSLSGQHHKVITGVVIINAENTISFADITDVEFHLLTRQQIEFYVDKYKPYDKAGAYAIQEWIGVVGIKSVNGDFYNVMGLPVSRLVQELKNI
ncbi:MAG TPA: Maf family nucleotide pyrophosphatase [Chitinophagaceae bacterium]|nr:Maf family nucleotide pyrophosphatase [Chitinophagaceae bacterium]